MTCQTSIRQGLRKHPFEFFAAFLVLVLGIYGIVDPDWPPYEMNSPWETFILSFEAIYFIVASLLVISTFFTRCKWPIESIVTQMFGWLFICFAGLMAITTNIFIKGSNIVHVNEDSYFHIAINIMWVGLICASFSRFLDMKVWFKQGLHRSE